MHYKTTFFSLIWAFLLDEQKNFSFLEWLFYGCSVIGWARHPGPGPRVFTPGQLSVEFVSVGGWLTRGDLALDSCAQFLAVAKPFQDQIGLSSAS